MISKIMNFHPDDIFPGFPGDMTKFPGILMPEFLFSAVLRMTGASILRKAVVVTLKSRNPYTIWYAYSFLYATVFLMYAKFLYTFAQFCCTRKKNIHQRNSKIGVRGKFSYTKN